jgi:hypothetical protein
VSPLEKKDAQIQFLGGGYVPISASHYAQFSVSLEKTDAQIQVVSGRDAQRRPSDAHVALLKLIRGTAKEKQIH